MLNDTQYNQTTAEQHSEHSRSTLHQLSSELARIEDLALAGDRDSDALEAVLRAIASLEHVCAVDVALAAGGDFVSVASSGAEALADSRVHHRVYADCIATGRLVRCGDTSTEPRAHGILFASLLITPLSACGKLIGVLAVYSNQRGIFGDDYIVPLATAAVVCSVLAPQVLEGRMRLNATVPESALQEHISTREKDGDLAAIVRKDEIRSVLQNKPAAIFAELEGSPTTIAGGTRLLRSPFLIAALLLVLSGVVFGSMQMLRRSAAVASKGSKPTAAATRLGEVTKLLGAPRPTSGDIVPADAQIKNGRLIQDGLPAYPPDALARSMQGDVTAILAVSERGAVEDVRVTGGDVLLANSVVSSLSHWRFAPFEVNGRAAAVEIPVIVGFRIQTETHSLPK